MDDETDEQMKRRLITREIPIEPTMTWRFYDGMSRERFYELKREGKLPVDVGEYDEVMRIVAEAKAGTQ